MKPSTTPEAVYSHILITTPSGELLLWHPTMCLTPLSKHLSLFTFLCYER